MSPDNRPPKRPAEKPSCLEVRFEPLVAAMLRILASETEQTVPQFLNAAILERWEYINFQLEKQDMPIREIKLDG